ncbi:YmfQ family protein [Nevskia ramosa]|uniref:YmfQ family protein n=1 Tax=Nevskia ramosa TaxID=64002 RepID=UPI0023527387|nr:putative phage tail protein [Nevskia ramosa]
MGMTAEDYAAQLAALLPTGPAWQPSPDTLLGRIVLAIGTELARVHARADTLRIEADPRSTTELLAEWELTAGLPDRCVNVAQSIEQRRAALLARLTGTGGASRSYFIGVAAAYGYTVTIEEPALHTWRMRSTEVVGITRFRAGLSTAGDPLASFGNEAFECLFNRIKPAHTALLFAYGI